MTGGSAVAPVRFEQGEAMELGGLRRRHRFEDAPEGIARQWREFLEEAGEIPGRLDDRLYGVMCGADADGLEYMCGVRVAALDRLAPGVGRIRIPARRYAVFLHDGPPDALHRTWRAILAWLEDGAYASAHAPDFELYADGVRPVDGGGAIQLWVGVVPR